MAVSCDDMVAKVLHQSPVIGPRPRFKTGGDRHHHQFKTGGGGVGGVGGGAVLELAATCVLLAIDDGEAPVVPR